MTGRRVLFIGSPGLGPARAAWRLLERGFVLAGAWHALRPGRRGWTNDRWLARHNPAFSLSAALASAGIQSQPVPPLARWSGWPAAFAAAKPDLLVSAHFRWQVPRALLDRLPDRALNLHPTLLPHYRGAKGHALLLADGRGGDLAGVTLHLMDGDFDTGALVGERPVPFLPGGDAIAWELALARAYAGLIDAALLPYLAGRLTPVPQSGAADGGTSPGLALTSDTPLERAQRLVEIFGQWRDLTYIAPGGKLRVVPPLRLLGPASGAPPRRRLLSVEVDLGEARVRLGRRLSGHGRHLRRRRRRLWAAAQP